MDELRTLDADVDAMAELSAEVVDLDIDDVEMIDDVIDDDEVLLVDEHEVVELVEDLDASELLAVDGDPDDETGDSVEDELKNFLQGLD